MVCHIFREAVSREYCVGSSTSEIQKNPGKYKRNKNEIELKSRERANRKHCLEHEINRLEQDVLYTLNRNEKKIGNAVNDKLANLIIGDSAPIALDDIILCQKIDVNLKKKKKSCQF